MQVTKYAKVVAQSEKGMASNTVVPILKEKVDTFKGMVPVVVALRNDSLKAHHWETPFQHVAAKDACRPPWTATGGPERVCMMVLGSL